MVATVAELERRMLAMECIVRMQQKMIDETARNMIEAYGCINQLANAVAFEQGAQVSLTMRSFTQH